MTCFSSACLDLPRKAAGGAVRPRERESASERGGRGEGGGRERERELETSREGREGQCVEVTSVREREKER
jgi:hypothetical protein